MRRPLRVVLHPGAILLLAILVPALALAQSKRNLAAEIDAATELLAQHAGGESADDRAWREAAQERIDLLRELQNTQSETEELPDTEGVPAELEKVDEALATERSRAEPAPLDLASEEELASYKKRHADARQARDEVAVTLAELRAARARGAEELKDLPRREAEAKQNRARWTGSDDRTVYRRESATLRLDVLKARRTYLDLASEVHSVLEPLLQSRLDLENLLLEREKKTLDFATASAAALRDKEAEATKERAAADLEADLASKDPLVRQTAALREEAAEAGARALTTKNEVDEVAQEIGARKEVIRRFQSERTWLQDRLEFGGSEVAGLLRNAREGATEGIQELRTAVRPRHAEERAVTQQALIAVLDRLWELQLPADRNPDVQKLAKALPEDRQGEAESAVRGAVAGEKGLLATLRDQKAQLETLQTKQGELATTVAAEHNEYRQTIEFCSSNLLFSQSNEPLSFDTVRQAAKEVPKVIGIYTEPGLWSGVSRKVRNITQAGILVLALLVLGSAGIVLPRLLRRRATARQEETAAETDTGFAGATPAALRFLTAIAPPAGLLAVSAILGRLDLPPPLDEALPFGFQLVGAHLAVVRLTMWFLRKGGVGIHVAGVRPENAQGIRLAVSVAVYSGLFLSVPSQLLRATSSEMKSLPRLLDSVWLVFLVWSLFYLVRRRGPLIRQIARPGGLLDRLWLIVGPLLLILLLAMIILDVVGYSEAAGTMMRNTIWSIAVLSGVTVLYSFLVRLIGRIARRVRSRLVDEFGFEQARESSDTVTEQLTRLSAILIMGALILLVLRAWDERLVVLDLLTGVELFPLEDGRTVTLLSVLRAFLAVAAGHFIVANLSGVYEFIVFPLLGSTRKGGQFVMLALSRYAILLVAYTLALVFLGVRLSSIGWLLTAASVGIGFGLQEIIANFVAGLILLLERPFQVGDIISVDDTSGTVDSISIRSTIVTNWDRQSVIIPNKDFITKKMTNWTRNDDVTRRKLEIRVAFGSDLEKVNRVLEETVKAHPNVLADPPPRVWMSSYESSGFGILVYFFTHVDNGLTTRAELYGQVYENLAGEGIEVPVQTHRVSVVHEPPAPDGLGKEE